MTCLNCGGNLKYINGIYICENCGSKQELSAFYEKTDVFICYVESDNMGRRTKDSIIAQDIYNKLENANINVFYERVSIGNLTGDEFEQAYISALNSSKAVIILGTSADNFDKLLEQNKVHLVNKRILPVYTDMNAYDIPKELNNLQATNYNNIGTVSDLIKNIFQILGRASEIDARKIADEKSIKRKKRIMLSVSIFFLIVVTLCSYFVFGTHYVLKSKKYDYAEKLVEKGHYIEAIEILFSIGDYKDSHDILRSIYDKYDGYYSNKDNSVVLHLNIIDHIKCEIEITKTVENKIVKTDISAMTEKNIIMFQFVDSKNNFGNGNVELFNDGIKLETHAESNDGLLCIGELEEYFELSNKSDAPVVSAINRDKLIEWLSVKTTEDDIYENGYELNFKQNVVIGGYEIYNIDNTGIELAMFKFDIQKSNIYNGFSVADSSLKSKTIFSIIAPANIIAPDKIGKKAIPFVEDDIIYVPYSNFAGQGAVLFEYQNSENQKTIEENTPIFATSRAIVSDDNWKGLLIDAGRVSVYTEAKEKYNNMDDIYWSNCEAENNTHYLLSFFLNDHNQTSGMAALYKVEKNIFASEFVTEVGYERLSMGESPKTYWQTHTGLAEEFPSEN